MKLRRSIFSLPRPVLVVMLLAVVLGGAFLVYAEMSTQPQTPIPFHTIPTAGAKGYSQPAQMVINDPDTWAKVWTQAFCTRTPPLSYPLADPPCEGPSPVNFTTRTVIAVFMGVQPGLPLYTIKIARIVQSGSNIVVHVLSTKAGNCAELAEETWPAYIVDIPKTEAHVSFATETFINHC